MVSCFFYSDRIDFVRCFYSSRLFPTLLLCVHQALPPRARNEPNLIDSIAVGLRSSVSAGIRSGPIEIEVEGSSLGSSVGGSSETGSMEEGAGAGIGEPFVAGSGGGGGAGGSGPGTWASAGGTKLPQVLQKNFGEVQGILEHNRVLIQEISQNQETRDADGLTRNVSLIRELNTNIARVVDLYGDLSGSFASAIAAKKAGGGGAAAAGADKGAPKRPRSAGAGQQQQ